MYFFILSKVHMFMFMVLCLYAKGVKFKSDPFFCIHKCNQLIIMLNLELRKTTLIRNVNILGIAQLLRMIKYYSERQVEK